jgi:tetratricopeptide (TPR) repeat protein
LKNTVVIVFFLSILIGNANFANAQTEADRIKASADACYTQSQYEEALTGYFNALTHYEQANDKKQICAIYVKISAIYANMENYIQAEKYVNKSLPLALELNDSLFFAHSYNKLMRITFAQEKWAECLRYADKCISLFNATKDYPILLCAKNTIAIIYMEEEQYAKALETSKEALEISEREELEEYIIESKLVMMSIYQLSGELHLAEEYALDLLHRIDSNDYRLSSVYKLLVQIYAQQGDYAKLTENLEFMLATLNRANDQLLSSALIEIELKYETEKKELKINALEDEKRLMIWLNFAVGGVLLLIIAASLLLWR